MSTRRGFLKGFGASILGVALGSRIAVEVAEAAPLLPPVKPTKLEPPDYIKQRMNSDLDGLQGGTSNVWAPYHPRSDGGFPLYIGEHASDREAERFLHEGLITDLENGMWYYRTSDNTLRAYVDGLWRNYEVGA